jgi:hypothetical protein
MLSVGLTRCSLAILVYKQVRLTKGRRSVSLTSACVVGVWTVVAPLFVAIPCAQELDGQLMCHGEVSERR